MILQDDPKRRTVADENYCPSAEDIRKACLAIQATWSEAERLRRSGEWWWAEGERESRALPNRSGDDSRDKCGESHPASADDCPLTSVGR